MPNWCNNVVEISHKDRKMMERVKSSFAKGELFAEFVPVPEDLHITAGRLGDVDEQKALELQEKANEAKYGYSNWYDFCTNEWGTKWDVSPYEPVTGDIDENNQLTLSFDTAWGPGLGAYEKMVEQGFDIRAYYYESGMGFCGVWDNGNDDYYQLDGGSADEVADYIPEALDEMFGISDNIREYEQENEETENE